MPETTQPAGAQPLHIAVLTISDTRTEADDRSGNFLAESLVRAGHVLAGRGIVPDHQPVIEAALREHIADPTVQVVLTTGGTGLTGRDVTPEALRAVSDKIIDGFGELFRLLSFESIGTSTIQSRAIAGVASGTYLFALPGSPSACRDGWDKILRPQLDSRTKPCNFAELLPRLNER